jgi:hypothetical protein
MADEERLEKHAEIIRKLVEHENTLQNFRLSWFLTSQSLLFAALGFAWDKGTTFVVCTLCMVGFTTAASALVALHLSDKAFHNIKDWWEKNLHAYRGPPRVGFGDGTKYLWYLAMPSRILPRVFALSWIVLLIYRTLFFAAPRVG